MVASFAHTLSPKRVRTVSLLIATLLVGCAPRLEDIRNVLLVSIDSLRADHLGCYGYNRPTSPTIDRLARDGVRFASASSPTSWTLPSHITLLTGLRIGSHLVARPRDVAPPDRNLLAETLSLHGFQTIGFYSGPFLHPAYGFDRGFDEYISCQGSRTDRLKRSEALRRSHSNSTNLMILEAFSAWARERARSPFFAFVHMWDPHFDYTPPDEYVRMFDATYTGTLNGKRIATSGFRPGKTSPRDLAHLIARYDGEIRYTDDTLGRILGVLDEVGHLDDTLVVITADHGDEFLEHGNKGHLRTVYQEVIRVPLVMWAGRRLPTGTTVDTPVTLADVAPTILDVLGIEAPTPFDGRSLAPALRGEPLPATAAISELYQGATTVPDLTMASIRKDDTKLVLKGPWSRQPSQCVEYDLASDPLEQSPRPVTNETLRAQLTHHLHLTRKSFLAKPTRRKGRTPEALPNDVVKQLKALGYIE